MQRVSPRALLLGAAATGALAAAMLVVFMLSIGGQATPKAQANFPPTSTAKKAPPVAWTPVPTASEASGSVSGVFDIRVGNLIATPQSSIYTCITRVEMTDVGPPYPVKSAATCLVDLGG